MHNSFPKDFYWGGAMSGPQTEGTKNKVNDSIWELWYKNEPEAFHNDIGPEITSNFYETYQEDIKLFKEIGMNSFRTSIQWSRLIKDFDTGEVDQNAVDFYNNVIDCAIANDIEIFVNLNHFDIPAKLHEEGNWFNRDSVDKFVIYADKCFELFGDRVTKWFVFNEPSAVVDHGFTNGHHFPNERNYKKAIQVQHHMILAQAKTIAAFKARKLDSIIGTILILAPTYPATSEAADVKAAALADLLYTSPFANASIKGCYKDELLQFYADHDLMFAYEDGDFEIIKANTIEFLGVNYYSPRRVQAKEHAVEKINFPEDVFDYYDWPEKRINPHRGWEIFEPGIYDLLMIIKNDYGNIPCFISENGMGVENEERFINSEGVVEDDYRIEFIEDHLKYVQKALDEGVNVTGYHMWAAMDCWSWTNAYKNRYGFISVDLATQKRTVKKSGLWLKEFVKGE